MLPAIVYLIFPLWVRSQVRKATPEDVRPTDGQRLATGTSE